MSEKSITRQHHSQGVRRQSASDTYKPIEAAHLYQQLRSACTVPTQNKLHPCWSYGSVPPRQTQISHSRSVLEFYGMGIIAVTESEKGLCSVSESTAVTQ